MDEEQNTDNIKIEAFDKKVIYVYKHIDVVSHEGWLKVGETKQSRITQNGNNLRIIEQHEASNVEYEILYTTDAVTNDGRPFSDIDIHRELQKQGIDREDTINPLTKRKSEWFKTDLNTVIETIDDYKASAVINSDGVITDFTLRDEQAEAVDVTTAYYEHTLEDSSIQPEFLWNAKPRFGKTLTAYCFAQHIKAKKVLIVTNRPAIADSWFRDFQKFDFMQTGQNDGKHRWVFTASKSVRKNLENIKGSNNILTREEQIRKGIIYPNFVHFISLQDIKGQNEDANSYKEKNKWIFKDKSDSGLEWDLLIIDESHEGVDTSKSFRVLENVNYNFGLHLSGTPFKALASNKFTSKQIYNWSYTDEQNAKSEWNIEDGNNPYASLPKLNIFTYQLSRALQITAEEAKDEGSEYAFDLGEFFRVVKVDGKDTFVYEDKVKLFLDNLANPDFQYPFSNSKYLESLRHSFWLLPGVASSKLMKQMLQEHPFFKDYTIILAAGDGDEDRLTNTALEEVRAAINGHNNEKHPLETKTITLSCGQLTTGVTVPAWTAVLMLNNVKSPAQYMQTAFRAQNPFEVATSAGETFTKENCYVFDFAPDRILQTLAEMADSGVSEVTTTREAKVQKLINFLPVIAEDDEGRMHELDANEVLTIPLKLITEEVVNRGFMSNRLFDNISGIFGAPQSVMDIINKMIPDNQGKQGDKSKNKVTSKPRIWVDNENKIHINEDIVVNTSNGLLGNKQYVEIGSDEEKEVTTIKTDIATELRNKNVPAATANIIMKEMEKKLPKVVAKLPDPPPPPGDPEYHKPEEPDEKPKPKEKTEEEKTRDRLRGFARTIPSFLMAYGNSQTTLHNFDENIPDDVFQDLTSITKDEFKQLRDGFEYEAKNEDTGQAEKRRFEGLFNESVFNASVQAFQQKRAELADYYLTDHSEDIFEYIPPQATNQIFTPKRVVKMMVDGLEEHNPDLFKRTDSTFIDLYMKSGLYITEIVKKLFANTRNLYSSDAECVKHILEKQVYGLAPTGVLHAITNSLIFGFDESHTISTKNFAQVDMLPYTKGAGDKSAQEIINELFYGGIEMKFDAVVGNPPYQDQTTGDSTQMPPIYHYFMEESYKLSEKVCLITPARFLFNAGATPTQWNKKMLNDPHLKVEYYKQKSSEVFPNTDIKGGVAVTYRDEKQNFGAIGTFTIFNELNSILRKVEAGREEKFSNIIYSAFSYQFAPAIHVEHPEVKKILSKGHENDITTGIFDILPEIFLTAKPKDSEGYIKYFGLSDKKRAYRWVKKSYIRNHPNLEKYKVWVPKANGSGAIGEVLSTPLIGEPLIGEPLIGSTHSFISIGAFDTLEVAQNALKYVKTKFARTLLGVLKITQDNPPAKWSKVPMQDFTAESDIDWSKSIPEIDQQLFKKYGLSQEEIEFIESRVKPME